MKIMFHIRYIGRKEVKLKPAKCKLLQKKVKFQGWCVGPDGIAIPPKEYSSSNRKTSTTKCPRINYHRGHFMDCAQLTVPLLQIAGSKGNKSFVWDDSHQEALENLKALRTSTPVMHSGSYRIIHPGHRCVRYCHWQ